MIMIWGRRSSANVIKVLWAATEMGLPFERKTVGGGFGGVQEPAYLAMNPNGLVPVLQDGPVTMFESNAIVRYLAARYGEGRFRPADPVKLALAEQWMEWQQQTIAPLVSAIFWQNVRTPPAQRNAAAVEEAEARLPAAFAIAGKRLQQSPYFAGEELTMADIVMGVFAWRLSQLKCRQPEDAAVTRWFDRLKTRKAFQEWAMVPIGANPSEWSANEKLLA